MTRAIFCGGHLAGGLEVVKTDGNIRDTATGMPGFHGTSDCSGAGARRMGGTLGEGSGRRYSGRHRFQALLLHLPVFAVVRQHGLIPVGIGDGLNAA